MTVEIEYKGNETNDFEYLDVLLEGEFATDGDGFLICENINWEKSDFTEYQNKVIEKYVLDNYNSLDKKICDEFLGQ